MGCDIHIYTEKKVNGKWINIDPLKFGYQTDNFDERIVSQTYHGRNYELFGFLAQVRSLQENGFEAKGFPSDASKQVKDSFKEWGCDAHTPSYLTLKELRKNLDKTVSKSALFSVEQKKKVDKSIERGYPDWDSIYPCCEWSSDTSLVKFNYNIPMNYIFKEFVETTIDHLNDYTWESKTSKHDEKSVRVVFWFDN